MARDRIPASWQRVGSIVTIVIMVATLYFAKELLVPFALAALFCFLLAPVVHGLQRLRLGRVPAVIVTTFLATAGFALLGWVVWGQMGDLAANVEKYKGNIASKWQTLRGAGDSPLAQIEKSIADVTSDVPEEGDPTPASTTPRDPGTPGARPPTGRDTMRGFDQRPVPVEIVERRPGIVDFLSDIFGPLLGPLGAIGVIFVLTIFMLVYQEDLRDRFIRLVSRGQLVVTTQAIAEASQRISRYLAMTLVVNSLYGIPIGFGLYLMGVPNAVLWGLLATLLRFIPYLGPWIAAAFPIALSVAVFPDWWGTGKVIGLFVVMELISNNAVEPWLYGSRTGLSPVAVIVAAVFWTWMWGVVGLLLAIPMTLILAVAGRYVPQLAFLNVLLGDQPSLKPEERFYQRLVAADPDEASRIADDYLKTHSTEDFYDAVVLPALRAGKHDVAEGRLEPEAMRALRETASDLLDEIADRPVEPLRKNGKGEPAAANGMERVDAAAAAPTSPPAPSSALANVRALFLTAGDETDALAAEMLSAAARRDGMQTRVLPGGSMSGESIEAVRNDEPDVICIVGLLPYAILRARHLCKRLRAEASGAKIAVALWDPQADPARVESRIPSSCADRVAVTFAKAVEAVRSLATEVATTSDAEPRRASEK